MLIQLFKWWKNNVESNVKLINAGELSWWPCFILWDDHECTYFPLILYIITWLLIQNHDCSIMNPTNLFAEQRKERNCLVIQMTILPTSEEWHLIPKETCTCRLVEEIQLVCYSVMIDRLPPLYSLKKMDSHGHLFYILVLTNEISQYYMGCLKTISIKYWTFLQWTRRRKNIQNFKTQIPG
jgi:hypothetical protein